ncbi:MAG: hypothetical protein R3F56_18170 [Planctomycetota bacterium]
MSAWRGPAWPAWVAASVFFVATVFVLGGRLLPVCALDHNVGVYVTLAELARQGVVYPHEQSTDLVYCTFYQPLAFLPYSILPGSGLTLVPSIRALVRVEVLACLAGVVVLLRRLRLRWDAALIGAAVAACATPVTAAMMKCIDDPRGAALALAAAAVFAMGGRLRPAAAAPVFVLAFLTKLTAPCAAGVAALAVALRRRQIGSALALLGLCAGGSVLVYAVAHGLLGWDLAGNGLRYALFDARPGRSLGQQVAHFGRDLACDSLSALLLVGGGLLALGRAVRWRADPVDVWLLAALARAFVEYGSHGTELNHLFEACLAAAVVVARAAAPCLAGWWGVVVLAFAALLGRPALRVPCGDETPLPRSQLAVAAQVLRAQPPAPTLCEDPLLAWTAGQRPLVTDPFLAGKVLDRCPQIRAAWFGEAGDPRALRRLVLLANPDEPGRADAWYTNLQFDARFLADVRRLFVVVAASDFGTVLKRR